MSIILLLTIVVYKNLLSTSVIDSLLIIAGFTYGPLLGLFSFGIFTNHKIHDKYSIIVCILSVIFTSLIFMTLYRFLKNIKLAMNFYRLMD